MKKITLILMVGAAVLYGLCSCNYNKGNELSFRRITVEQSYRLVGSAIDYESENDLSIGCRTDILMPEKLYANNVEAIKDSILAIAFKNVESSIGNTIEKGMKSYLDDSGYALADTIMPDSVVTAESEFLSRYDGYVAVEGDLETLTHKVLSYALTVSNYFPESAHGMYGTVYINYDLVNGCFIHLSDLFTDKGMEALPRKIRKMALALHPLIGATDIRTLPADNNFYITASNDIVFAYQPYEVASYAQGEIQIPVPAYLLSDFLTPLGAELLLK